LVLAISGFARRPSRTWMTKRLGRRIGVAWLALAASLCVPPALAQFEAPYDPDFPSPPASAPALAPTPVEAPAPVEAPPVAPVEGAPKDFQVIERPEGQGLLDAAPAVPAAPPARAPRDPGEVRAGMEALDWDAARFNRVREAVDRGEEPGVERIAAPAGTSLFEELALSTAAPKPPPPEVELPTYGTSLSVTGRKLISFTFSEKRFMAPQRTTNRPQTTNLVEIDQQLQLRMQGKVGPKITVNVDYDDTKENQQDISIVYTGDPNEVVQNVSFGDIDLSLPSTEFVSYNKQLFGIRADVKHKGFRATFIGSRTKGQTKSKQFVGNSQFVGVDILDTSYIRRQYYDVSFGVSARLPIRAGTERVILAKQETGSGNINEQVLTVDDLSCQGVNCVNSSSFTGRFLTLVAGQDYTIDYAKGIVQFRNQLLPQYVAAIDYEDALGNRLAFQTSTTTLAANPARPDRFKLIKTVSELPIVSSNTETGFNRELKTFYSIGQTQIVRDNGRGNFIFRVLDQNRSEVGPNLDPVQKYPDTVEVDFENGIFRLKQPFSVSNSSPGVVDPDVYAETPIHKRLFRVEYNFRFKTFFLEPNLVVQSEIVILDGLKLTRNVDYFIDYEAGFVTFFNPDRITANSTIDIAFEVAPFAGLNNDTLLGGRVSHEWGEGGKYGVGSTILYQAGAKSQTVPQITELAKSLLVYEFDARLNRVKVGERLIVSLAGEFAQSRQNLNLNPFALIDNMEGVRQDDLAPTTAPQWQIASNPTVAGFGSGSADPAQVTLITEDVGVNVINPNAPAQSGETQKVLNFNYSFAVANATSQVSIVYPFSVSGVDMSQKTILEVVMLGDASNNFVNFHLGGISEDSDGDGVLDTEDANNDGILQPAEDIGWLYNPAGKTNQRFTANNGLLDTEDLNRNGALTPADFTGGDFGYACANGGTNCTSSTAHKLFNATDQTTHTVVNFGTDKYRVFQIPLNISTATASQWTAIKHLRVSVSSAPGGAPSGTLKFARIAVVGNTWQRGTAGDPASPNSGALAQEALTVTPVNNVDNPGIYTPIFNAAGDAAQTFNDLYGSVSALQRQNNTRNLSEQSLNLTFEGLVQGSTVTTKRVFPRAIDVSQHRFFQFLLNGNGDASVAVSTNAVFFLRAGSNVDYFEVQVPLGFTGWRRVRIEQTDSNGDSVMDGWKIGTPGSVVVTSGTPSLQQIGQLVAGVKIVGAPTPATVSGRVYLNEIHLAEPVTRVGNAQKLSADFEVPGWASFGAKHRFVDRNFQTPTSVVSNQDKREDSAYLNFTRLPWFPMTFNLSRAITDTPSTVQTGSLSNVVNLLQQGKVTTWIGSAQGNISYGAYPRVSLAHTRNRVEYDILTRKDDRQTFNGTLQYGVPLDNRFVPKTIDATAGHTRYDVSFENQAFKLIPGNFDTSERGNSYGMRLSFVPWSGSSFNPNWSRTKVTESRVDSTSGRAVATRYDKSFTQSMGFSSNYRLLSWFNPQVNYQIDTIENNILSVSTFIVRGSTYVFAPGDIKTVNRNANGSISLPITIGEIFPRSKLFRSMSVVSGYQLQDGDVWNQVERGLDTSGAFWIRTPLRSGNPAVQRANLTLRDTWSSTQRWSPLESYDLRDRKAAWRTLSLSNNYVLSVQRSEVTGTPSKTIARTLPDAVASISQLERLLFVDRWAANMQMNFRFARRTTENVGSTFNLEDAFGTDLRSILLKKYDTLLSYNLRLGSNKDLRVAANTQSTRHEDATAQVTFDLRKFRLTPKVDLVKDSTQLGTGVKSQDVETITPSLLARADLALPSGLRLPGSAKPLLFTNRIIWTSTLSMAMKRSPVTVADNSRLLSFNTSGDYEIAKNLRMTLNGSFQRLWHRFLKEEDFLSYAFGSTLTFQF
jgi:hypothetical protein